MFASLKNKIKEETGDDINRLSSLVSAAPGKLTSKGRHSRHGSTTSLGSFTIDGARDESTSTGEIKLSDGRVLTQKEFKKLESKEDEWRKKLQRKDEECVALIKKVEDTWRRKLEERERESSKIIDSKDSEIKDLRLEIKSLHIRNDVLQAQVKQIEDYKKKICQYQEDIDQLESFQTQEVAKVKHLLLEKEQKLLENEKTLLRNKEIINDLTREIQHLQDRSHELHDSQDRLQSLQHKTDQEKAQLTSKLAAQEETCRFLKERVEVLDARCRANCTGLGAELTVDERIQALLGERTLLERLLSEAHEHLSEVKTTWSGTISSLETQVGRLCRQASEESAERRLAEQARDESVRNFLELEKRLKNMELDSVATEEKMRCLTEQRDMLAEENENMRSKAVNCNGVNGHVVSSTEVVTDDKTITSLQQDNEQLTKSLESQKEDCMKLMREITELKDSCDEEKRIAEQLQKDMAHESREKDAMMMRNAEVSQEVELVRQELRMLRNESNDLQLKIDRLQLDVNSKEEALEMERTEKNELLERIRNTENVKTDDQTIAEKDEIINNLQTDLFEKNKAIKSLQMRVADMKKTLQRELNVPSRTIDPGGQNGAGCIPSYGPAVLTPASSEDVEDVNFKYLKHVLFKFLTCREYEAQHLTRAVATLLRFTAEEERLLKETMDWRTSWFGTRPKVSNNTLSRTMPPS